MGLPSSDMASTISTRPSSCTGERWAAIRSNASGHYNLGRAFAERGQLDRAIQSYHRAIELAPEDADAHQSLARALVMQNQLAEAIYRYRRTLEIEPDRVGALLDLAWIIATAPNLELRVPAEGVRLAERAVRLTDGSECDCARHAGRGVCRGRPDRSRD